MKHVEIFTDGACSGNPGPGSGQTGPTPSSGGHRSAAALDRGMHARVEADRQVVVVRHRACRPGGPGTRGGHGGERGQRDGAGGQLEDGAASDRGHGTVPKECGGILRDGVE